MNPEQLQSELQQFKAQAIGMVNWADMMLKKMEPKKSKGLSQQEKNNLINRRNKLKSQKSWTSTPQFLPPAT